MRACLKPAWFIRILTAFLLVSSLTAQEFELPDAPEPPPEEYSIDDGDTEAPIKQ